MYAPRNLLRCGLFDFAMLSNRETSSSSRSWKRPGRILNRGTAKMRMHAASTRSAAETVTAETKPGFTSFRPKKLILPVSCRTASRMVS